MPDAIVFVHGGVSGSLPLKLGDLGAAVDAGRRCASAVDAVEAATRVLEDDPALQAGTGAVLNRAGEVELDAGLCDGSDGRFGGVAGVAVKNPVSLARRVMDRTPHVLMMGPGAAELGRDMGLVTITDEARARWQAARDEGRLTDASFGAPASVDTVGAVAVDAEGRLAAASSTGGVFGKLPGRVGDAAILGAGLFASQSAAVVGTGVGELFIESLACFRVAALIEAGAHPQEACNQIIRAVGARDPRPIGLLALVRDGSVGAAFAAAGWQIEGPGGALDPELVRVES